MATEMLTYPMFGKREKMKKASLGGQMLNWSLLAASMGGAVLAGIWTSGLLLGLFLPESMGVSFANAMGGELTLFDYLASLVAGGWIGYVTFFVLWDCIFKRVGRFYAETKKMKPECTCAALVR